MLCGWQLVWSIFLAVSLLMRTDSYKKRICVVTGSRAEYGLLQPLMHLIREDPDLELQVIASAMHLSPEFGLTYRQIEEDGFVIDAKVEMLLSGDTPVSVAKSTGLGVIGFADAYQRLVPDLVVLLGDRFETMAAAQSAMLARIPIAHLHGGEVTEGAVDDSIRHAISKMAHLHFVATDEFRKRVIQLGEDPANVHVSGAPGIDVIRQTKLFDRNTLQRELDFELGALNFLVTYHPLTLANSRASNNMDNLFAAIDSFKEARVIFTFANADADGRQLIEQVKQYAAENPTRVLARHSLGQCLYLSCLQHVDAVIGNSSSGLLEAPSFGKPTVNIGDRQKGRPRAISVIDCDESADSIERAITSALSSDFIETASGAVNPYGDGHATLRILQAIKRVDLQSLSRKVFHDINFSPGDTDN